MPRPRVRTEDLPTDDSDDEEDLWDKNQAERSLEARMEVEQLKSMQYWKSTDDQPNIELTSPILDTANVSSLGVSSCHWYRPELHLRRCLLLTSFNHTQTIGGRRPFNTRTFISIGNISCAPKGCLGTHGRFRIPS